MGRESFQALFSSRIARSTGLFYGINTFFIYFFFLILCDYKSDYCGCCQHFLSFLDAKNAQNFCHKCCELGIFHSEKEILHSGYWEKFLLPVLSVVTSLITRGCCVHAGLKTACSSEMPWKRAKEFRGWGRRGKGFWSYRLAILAMWSMVSNILWILCSCPVRLKIQAPRLFVNT